MYMYICIYVCIDISIIKYMSCEIHALNDVFLIPLKLSLRSSSAFSKKTHQKSLRARRGKTKSESKQTTRKAFVQMIKIVKVNSQENDTYLTPRTHPPIHTHTLTERERERERDPSDTSGQK
jgi:hypothetical protein